MILNQIHLSDFRNYDELNLNLHPKLNIFIGKNAQGKTNLLEAIYFLSLGKSHRTAKDKELIHFERSAAIVHGKVTSRNNTFPLSIALSKQGKRAKVNHLEVAKLSQYIGHLNVVLFAPEDLNIVKGSPQIRRKFINVECGQISKVYLNTLTNYQKLLIQKNHLLKSRTVDHTMLDVINDQIAAHASVIMLKRQQFIEQIEKYAKEIHSDISNQTEDLTIHYQPNIKFESDSTEALTKEIQHKLNEIKDKEIERFQSLIGPHRDDVTFFINNFNVQTYGSQGQQRTTALSVKLAELSLIRQEVGEYPILLLDDVLSELDEHRQSHLLTTIRDKVQTFVTTTSISDINHRIMDDMQSYTIENGSVIQ